VTEENLKFLEGDFEILDKLGRGGMGQVFKARQKSLDRLVAIKILPLSLCKNDEFIGRFKREARLAGKFYHPNAIQVFDIGENKGQYYYVMEYVEGGNLKEKLAQDGRLNQNYVLSVLRQVLSVLKEAETLKIIHRDIKPDNIMLTSEGVVKLADLGLAREVNDNAGLTQQKIAIGTPHYMAPEQAQGKPVDMRADQYALGITAFHLLTGRTPFTGKNNMEILVQHVKKPMIKPSSICADISPFMDKLILKMTEKEPKNRFQTISETLKAVEKVADAINATKEIKTPGGTKIKSERTSILERRKEKSSYAGLFIFLILILLIGFAFVFIDFSAYTNPYQSIKEIALLKANKLDGEKRYEESLAELKDALKKLPPNEHDAIVARINEVETKVVAVLVEKIMVSAFDSIQNCEIGIEKLDAVINKYNANAILAKARKAKLKERIAAIKEEEEKLLDSEKEKAKEEKINALSLEVAGLLTSKKFKQAISLVNSFKEKNTDGSSKVNNLNDSILSHETDYLDQVLSKADTLLKNNEFDKAAELLQPIKEDIYQKELVVKIEEKLKGIPKLKDDYNKETVKKGRALLNSTKESIFSLLKIAEVKAAKVKLDSVKGSGLTDESYDVLAKYIESYGYVHNYLEVSLQNEFKEGIKVNRIGNRNIDAFITSVKNGVLQYLFLDSKLELTLLNEDWASTYTLAACRVAKIAKSNRLMQLSHFAYVNGDIEGAYNLSIEAASAEGSTPDLAKYTKNIHDDFLNWLDLQFDSVIDKTKNLINEKNKARGKLLLNDFIKKYGNTIIYKERKQEIDKLLLVLAEK